jgi:hypothetical protein
MFKQINAWRSLAADLLEEGEAHVGRSSGVNYSSPSLSCVLDLPIRLSYAPKFLASHVIGALGS